MLNGIDLKNKVVLDIEKATELVFLPGKLMMR